MNCGESQVFPIDCVLEEGHDGNHKTESGVSWRRTFKLKAFPPNLLFGIIGEDGQYHPSEALVTEGLYSRST